MREETDLLVEALRSLVKLVSEVLERDAVRLDKTVMVRDFGMRFFSTRLEGRELNLDWIPELGASDGLLSDEEVNVTSPDFDKGG